MDENPYKSPESDESPHRSHEDAKDFRSYLRWVGVGMLAAFVVFMVYLFFTKPFIAWFVLAILVGLILKFFSGYRTDRL